MAQDTVKYDVAIIGTGIGGSTLAAVLARLGLKVVVFEAGNHPRFAIGESMILEAAEVMRALATYDDVPELAYYRSENYFDDIGTQHGVKRHFSFLLHNLGQPDGVEIVTDKDRVYRAEYLVDGSGMKSLMANKLGWRHRDLKTQTRTIFTHMIDLPCYNNVGLSRKQCGHPYRLSEDTLHHTFKGGWLWVILFNNHPRATNPLCSAGLQLDPRVYPPRADLSPEEEFKAIICQSPDSHYSA